MRCRVCGATQQPTTTDLPFKTGDRSIVILKSLPVFQCEQCSEYSMDDPSFSGLKKFLRASTPELNSRSFRSRRNDYIRSGTGIPNNPNVARIVWRKTSAQTARRWRSAGSFSLRIGYLW